MSISVGSGTSGTGGAVSVLSGRSTVHSGGALSLESGEGTATSSGVISIRTANGGASGVSGRLMFSSGSASGGNSGALYVGSGVATGGRGGMVSISVGSGTSGSGGAVSVLSGRSTVDDRWRAERAEWRGRGHGVNERKHRDSQRELGRIGIERYAGVQHGHVEWWEQRWADHRIWRCDGWSRRHGDDLGWERHERHGRRSELAVGAQHVRTRAAR